MTNISHGMAGFSDPRMTGQHQRDASEDRKHAFDRDDPSRMRSDARRADVRGDEANAQRRALDFRARMHSALGQHEGSDKEEEKPEQVGPVVLLASVAFPGPATPSVPAPDATIAPQLGAYVEQIHRLVDHQLRADARAAGATTVHLELPPFQGAPLAVQLLLDGDGLDVVFSHLAAEPSQALVIAAGELARGLASRLPSRRIRIFGRGGRRTGEAVKCDGLSALSEIFRRGGDQS